MVIDAMKNKYPLPKLLCKMKIAKSSYYYQTKAQSKRDKYQTLRDEITKIFHRKQRSLWVRRIYGELKKIGTIVSEKVILRLMKEEGLEVKTMKARRYSSYKGEITPAVPNEVERNFHSDNPKKFILSDISEFAIPAGKVYLSPAIDCFDGMLVAWRISKYPNAELVNGMLDDVIARLNKKRSKKSLRFLSPMEYRQFLGIAI